MATNSQAYTKLEMEVKRKRRRINRAYIYWPCALFFVWAPALFAGLAFLMKNMGHWRGITDPLCIGFFIAYALIGPLCAFLVLRTQRALKFLWALCNASICPTLLLLWLTLIVRKGG